MDENINKARFGLLLGIGVGIALASATDNIGVGIGVGVALAVAFSQGLRSEKKDDKHQDESGD